MIVDGVTGLYLLIEKYSAHAAWAVLFAFPVLVLSYVFGLIATTASHELLIRLRGHSRTHELELFLRAAAMDNQAVVERYLGLVQHQVLLEGALIGFATMSLGSVFAVRWLGPYSSFGWIAAAAFAGLAILCPFLARSLARQAEFLATKSKDRPEETDQNQPLDTSDKKD